MALSQSGSQQQPEMTLAASLEWSILQGIGVNTRAKWSLWSRHTRAKAPQHIDNNLTFLEIDLRRILLVKLAGKTLPLSTFNELQKDLGRLCRYLNNFVNPTLIAPNVPTTGDGGSPTDTYSNLRVLLKLVSDPDRNGGESPDLYLVAAPPGSTALFLVPPRSVAEVLGATEASLIILRTLFQHQGNGFFRPLHSPHTQSPLTTAFGKRAGAVLEGLLQRDTTCEFTHELLLALSEKLDAPEQNIPAPTLDILLSDCSRQYQHQDCPREYQRHEAQCLPYQAPLQQLSDLTEPNNDLGTVFGLDVIDNLCSELRERQRENTLILFFERDVLFSGRERHGVPSPSCFDATFLQSFHDLIKSGAFSTPTRNDHQAPILTLGPNQKDILALKLAHCFTQFFLHAKPVRPAWDSKLIYLLHPPKSARDYFGSLYMPFTRLDDTVRQSTPLVRIVDPALIAFSKLLLEIKSGKEIDLGNFSDPAAQWAELGVHLSRLEEEDGGLYAEAVRGALWLEQSSRPRSGEDPVLALERAMRDKILSHLETAVNPPLRDGKKRHRSNSNLDLDTGNSTQTLRESVAPLRLSKRPRISVSQVSDAHPASRNAQDPNRVTIFRARHITLGADEDVTDIVTEIVKANVPDGVEFNLQVRGITTSAEQFSESTIPRSGSSVIWFRGDMPRNMKLNLARDAEAELITNNRQGDLVKRSMEVDCNFIGVTTLYEPPLGTPVKADIIAIHGLNGHPCGSWLSKTRDPVLWLQDFLPQDFPDCRVISYGYKSNFFQDKDHERHKLVYQAETLWAKFPQVRSPEIEKRPIIFIAHSYGGLILGRALAESFTKGTTLLPATAALFLMACPMRGFHVSDLLHVMNTEDPSSSITVNQADTLLERLGSGDFFRNELSAFPDALKAWNNIKVYSFYELGKTKELTTDGGVKQRAGKEIIVADINKVLLDVDGEDRVPSDKDHSAIVKFGRKGDETYRDIKCRIDRVLDGLLLAKGGL